MIASKTYTAKEMREEAKLFCARGGSGVIAAMLLQAADALERDERRVKRYEYATILSNGDPSQIHDSSHIFGYHAFRREVGEWEEVK